MVTRVCFSLTSSVNLHNLLHFSECFFFCFCFVTILLFWCYAVWGWVYEGMVVFWLWRDDLRVKFENGMLKPWGWFAGFENDIEGVKRGLSVRETEWCGFVSQGFGRGAWSLLLWRIVELSYEWLVFERLWSFRWVMWFCCRCLRCVVEGGFGCMSFSVFWWLPTFFFLAPLPSTFYLLCWLCKIDEQVMNLGGNGIGLNIFTCSD